jgi:hypothetical protein
MELLIFSSLDLFQIDLTYNLKSSSQELKFFINAPMMTPIEFLKFFHFVKFPITQSVRNNLTMIPHVVEVLQAVGQDHQFKLFSQSDLNYCIRYGSTYLCKGRDVMRKDQKTPF